MSEAMSRISCRQDERFLGGSNLDHLSKEKGVELEHDLKETPQNRRILLIDDMPAIHEDFRKILATGPTARELDETGAALFGMPSQRYNAFELDSAYQGHEGVAMVEAAVQAGRPYAMAFVDMLMPPGWDGVETIERLWRVDPRVQIVICTAYSDHPWEEVLARLDVQDRLLILKKPFDLIEVSQLARTLTAKWALARLAASQINSLEQAVHDLKATEAAQRQSNAELAEFAHSLAHDLRAPLSAISAFSHLLTGELAGCAGTKARHYLERICAGAAMEEQLIQGLLLVDHVSRAPLCIEPVDLGALSRQILDELRHADPNREVSVTVQEGLLVQIDRQLIQAAMRHLLGNAWKFTSLRAHAEIEFGTLDRGDGEAVFFVRDNGTGFDMTYAAKLFHTFHRLHDANEFPGTGVGLVAASRIIGRHAGRIWADSKLGEGATFYFTLPPIRHHWPRRKGRTELPGTRLRLPSEAMTQPA